ncbi:microtubule-associated serine/threonine-protein kinase 4-like [Phyllobates terribilis]|uniref:microtubule-associated serine/threonine-protein kinase 4-like n=1 Tax=Phyllobates terribilis TaxID=111132 RepID=UPI003CCACB10
MAKVDVEAAFRLLPIHPDSFNSLGFQFDGSFYVDKCLPMGCALSCSYFEAFSTFIEWVVAMQCGKGGVAHYLDDVLFVGSKESAVCSELLRTFEDISQDFGIPLALEKTVYPPCCMEFLGIVIDSLRGELTLPTNKVEKCKTPILELYVKKKTKVKEIESVLGLLAFASGVIPMGRVFCRRLSLHIAGIRNSSLHVRVTRRLRRTLKYGWDFYRILVEAFTGFTVWILGHSFVHWAEQRALERCYGPNLSLPTERAENRSQYGDLAFVKELDEKVLCVLEGPACSSERLETPEGDDKDEQNPETPDPDRSQPGPSSDLITETSDLADPDSVILEIPEIQEPAGNLMESLIPARKPHMSDYETSKLISSGDFGAVYLVHHKDSQLIFAMKKIAKKNLDTPKEVEGAYLERDILTFADCLFVTSMLCSFPTRSHLCMVMEYVGGGDCRTLLTRYGPFPVLMARLYFAEAVLAVEYLHSYGVVHRDLKPDNLLITSAGHIKVTDFGLSKVGLMIPKSNTHKESMEDITREFMDTGDCGTPNYKAPEIILNKGCGRPVDWWSMGTILHEFLLGSVPFDGDSLTDVYKSIVTGDIIWDFDHAPHPNAQDLITDLLRTNPAHRLGTGGACEIKSCSFLCELDFDNLLSQKPEYVPPLLSEVDTSLFINHADIEKHVDSEDEEDTIEKNESPDFQNFTSSSERLSKLCTIATRTMNNEDPKSPPECTPGSGTNISEMQKESFPESDRDDAISCLPSSSPLSGSIFRRILSSCRRGLSRAARVFACCHCTPSVI